MNEVDHRKRDAREVSRMFSGIGDRYDLLNHVLSFGLDIGWRRAAARETRVAHCERILDVCTGTGDMALELNRFWKGRVFIEGLDLSSSLLEKARRKAAQAKADHLIVFREGNAESLPYPDAAFDAITITFGLRNVTDRAKALREFHRVAKRGARFVCLEFSRPTNPFFSALYAVYLTRVVPLLSRVFGSDPTAYRYLGNTIRDFPNPSELALLIESAGWNRVSYRRLSWGIVALHTGVKN